MKASFIFSLLLSYIIQVNASLCWDHNDPLNPWKKTLSSTCGIAKKKDVQGNLSDDVTSDTTTTLTPEQAFQFDFSCGVNDPVLCGKAENSFKSAGLLIAKVVNFKAPVTVNATFANFCQALGECGGKILGAAGAARTIPLQDDDNMIRQYPQALVKQFGLQPAPAFGPFDIQAFFNAEADLFFGDGQITPNQFDFQYIILHELIHGLGFASGWNNYFSEQPVALTPDPSFLESVTSLNDPVTYNGFDETAFDKYMVNAKLKNQSPKRMTDYATAISGFAKVGTKFPTVSNLLDTFASSSQIKISTDLIADSQISKTFAFQPKNARTTDDLIFLETNIAFQQGSSISHVDILSFNRSIDFLEVFNAKKGQSLSQILTAVGGSFPIGPKLLSVLETLGYATANNTNPYKPRLPNSPKLNTSPPTPLPVAGSTDSTSNQKPSSSAPASHLISSINILYVFVIVAITLLF